MRISPNEYKIILRSDFVAFAQRAFHQLNPETEYLDNWHIHKIAEKLEECRQGKVRRLIVNVPPRSLKSHLASIAFPAWILGHKPTAQIICASYAQDLAEKLAGDCRAVLSTNWYQELFSSTRFASNRQAVHDFATTLRGSRLATSVGGVLTGRGSDLIIIDDPLKPDEALSESQRQSVNDWFDHTLSSRLNDKRTGCIILIMQRLHEDDLVGHVMKQEQWEMLRFPAIAEEDENHSIQTIFGRKTIKRERGEALHAQREPLATLAQLREVQGEYNFSGQYQQSPAPLGGGLVKSEWFKRYSAAELPADFEMIFQSWDTANKPGELNDHSVCTTWGVKDKNLYLLHVYRQRLGYPELKRTVLDQLHSHSAKTVLIEDKASGTQLIQDLTADGVHSIKKYVPTMDKVMRLHSVTNMIENGSVHLPEKAFWIGEYLHELAIFPNGKYDDQVDSTSQALDWFKNLATCDSYGLLEYWKRQQQAEPSQRTDSVSFSPWCCGQRVSQVIPGGLRCMQCGKQFQIPGNKVAFRTFNRNDVLNRFDGYRVNWRLNLGKVAFNLTKRRIWRHF